MVPVRQTIFSGPTSNCFQACVASVLELPLVEVPNFATSQETWFDDLTVFLHRRGLYPMVVDFDPLAPSPRGIAILSFQRATTAALHTVVVVGGSVVWDPAPNKEDPLWDRRSSWVVFCAADPSRWVGK